MLTPLSKQWKHLPLSGPAGGLLSSCFNFSTYGWLSTVIIHQTIYPKVYRMAISYVKTGKIDTILIYTHSRFRHRNTHALLQPFRFRLFNKVNCQFRREGNKNGFYLFSAIQLNSFIWSVFLLALKIFSQIYNKRSNGKFPPIRFKLAFTGKPV